MCAYNIRQLYVVSLLIFFILCDLFQCHALEILWEWVSIGLDTLLEPYKTDPIKYRSIMEFLLLYHCVVYYCVSPVAVIYRGKRSVD